MAYHSRLEKYVPKVTASNGNLTTLFGNTLNSYAPDDFITKQALCRLFNCSRRTFQRMTTRHVLPPPVIIAGKRVWHAGTLGTWLANAAKRKQAEVEAETARIRAILADHWNNWRIAHRLPGKHRVAFIFV